MEYIDVITHCTDTKKFMQELKIKKPKRVDDSDPEDPKFKIRKATKLQKNKNNKKETLGYVRADAQDIIDIEEMEFMFILGTYEEVFADVDKRATYDRIYHQAPIEVDDGEGGVILYTPSEKFVVFY